MGESNRGLIRKEKSLAELYQLKYDTTLDLYQRVAHAKMVLAYEEYYDSVGSGELTHPTLEYYLYKTFGSDVIGSIAFALDPYWQIVRVPNGKFYDKYRKVLASTGAVTIVPVNRTRRRTSVPYTDVRLHEEARFTITSSDLVYSGGGYSVRENPPAVTSSTYDYVVGSQSAFLGTVSDTTWKTRNSHNRGVTSKKIRSRDESLNSQGEFERFDLTTRRVPFYWSYSESHFVRNLMAVGNNLWTHYDTKRERSGFTDNCAIVSSSAVSAMKTGLQNKANAIISDQCDRMFARCVPQRRYFNAAYQLGELKDVPQLLRSTLSQWYAFQNAIGGAKEFVKILGSPSWWTERNVARIREPLAALGFNSGVGKGLADLYLSFKFGWESILQAVEQLVKSPINAAEDVNRLIKRNGKFTNLSSSASWTESYPSPPGMTFAGWFHFIQDDPNYPTTTSGILDVNVRCMANVGVNFPDVDVPGFSQHLWAEKLGLIATPGDLLDLIPFTWLVDWFAGINQYVHLMDSINGDQSLVNYGFMTVKLAMEAKSTHGYKAHVTSGYKSYPPDNVNTPEHVTEDRDVLWLLTGSYLVEYEKRISLASVMNVKYTSGHGLSAYQKNVLGSLLQKFT